MTKTGKALQKYLSNYAEPEVKQLQSFSATFDRCLVVPCYRESYSAIQKHINHMEQRGNTLLILVANRPASDDDTQWYNELLQQINNPPQWQSSDNTLKLLTVSNGSAILLVDRVLNGLPLPTEQGVGLARKIGADIACWLIVNHHIHSPWIASTDADTQLPEDYFDVQSDANTAAHVKTAALIYPYRHIFDADFPRLPTLLYEFKLHYYVEGLRWAGSPYAYHTLGSIITVHYQHYAQVRGFPKRAGAEDFYLLNKLAKTGSILSLQHPVITIEARYSNRVPFGTGPATLQLEQQRQELQTPLYHPASFAYLKAMLELLNRLAESPQENYQPLLAEVVGQQPASIDPDQLLQSCAHLELTAVIKHCRDHGKDYAARLRQLNDWFDAFKTLKLIHGLRDRTLGTIPFGEWAVQSEHWRQPGSKLMRTLQREILQLLAASPIRGNNCHH